MALHQKALMRAFVALFFCCAFVLLPFSALQVGTEVWAASSDYWYQKAENEKSALAAQEKKTKELQGQISNLQNTIDDFETLKRLQEEEIASLDQEIATMNQLIATYTDQIAERDVEIANLKDEMFDQFCVFKERLVFLHESNNEDYIDFLLNSGDFADFLSRAEIMNDMFEYDEKLITGLKEDRERMETMREEAAVLKAACEETIVDCEARSLEVEAKIAVYNDTIANYQEALSELEDKKQESLEEQRALQNEVNDLISSYQAALAAEEAARKQGSTTGLGIPDITFYNDSLQWPFLSNAYTISQYYKGSAHTGIDVSTYRRSVPVYAAGDGYVLFAGTGRGSAWSYGNYVIIYHGDIPGVGSQVTTLSAHLNTWVVNQGETVTKGQLIGYTGTTGNSTGIHLHFMIYVNGSHRNPLAYVRQP